MSRRRSQEALRRLLRASIVAIAIVAASASHAADPSSVSGETPTKKRELSSTDKHRRRGSEHFRFGPIVGLGFPRPFAVEGFAKLERVFGVGFEYSFLPTVNLVGVEMSFRALSADFRVFPFRGGFFVGARAGRQWLDAKTTLTVERFGSFTEWMTASTWFINPRAGYLHTFDSGITLGIDAGVQLPIQPSYDRSGAATEAGRTASTFFPEKGLRNVLARRSTSTVS
ncbi:MAG TPA: hypothetical protein VM580_15920, partial [Labilithrix sp.]|nr:hypothetical protein [Labilithrix sp.]